MAKWRILIADDEDDIRSIVRATLGGRYEVVEAYDGVDALAKLEMAEPDFVVLDVMMPLMDGFQTCQAIRKHPKFSRLSVLFLSALNTKEEMKLGYDAGANLYLTKPFEPSRLLRNVDLFFETNPPATYVKKHTVDELRELERKGPEAIAHAQAAVASVPTTPPKRPETNAPAMSTAPPKQEAVLPPLKNPTSSKPASAGNWMDRGDANANAPNTPTSAYGLHTPSRGLAQPAGPILPRVLVVDDDPDVISVIKGAISAEYEVFSAPDGITAIEKITTYQPDVLLLDAMMPKMSGYQLCQSLRRNARFSKTPILFVSAKSSPRDQEYAKRIGGNDFIAKPFSVADLLNHVRKLTRIPGFKVLPKTLSVERIEQLESEREDSVELRQDRLHRKEETELEKFVREHQQQR